MLGVQVNVSLLLGPTNVTQRRLKLKFCVPVIGLLSCSMTMFCTEIFIMVHFAQGQKILHTGHESLEGALHFFRTVGSDNAQTSSYEILIIVSLAWLAMFLMKLCLLCFKMLAYVFALFLF